MRADILSDRHRCWTDRNIWFSFHKKKSLITYVMISAQHFYNLRQVIGCRFSLSSAQSIARSLPHPFIPSSSQSRTHIQTRQYIPCPLLLFLSQTHTHIVTLMHGPILHGRGQMQTRCSPDADKGENTSAEAHHLFTSAAWSRNRCLLELWMADTVES